MKTIAVSDKILALCNVRASNAALLTRDETVSLMTWCDYQSEDLWEGLTLQEILNVYRVSAEYDTFEGFAEEEPKEAVIAYNLAVLPKNKYRAEA